MSTISEKVRHYIDSRPTVKESLRRKIVNYSSLAREISRSYRVPNSIAIAAAIRRYASRLKIGSSSERLLDSIFAGVHPVVRTGMSIAIIRKTYPFEALEKLWREIREAGQTFQMIEAERTMTLVFSSAFDKTVRRGFGRSLRELKQNVALLSLSLPEKAMNTPGVSARLSTTFAAAGINMLEELTCSGEYLLVIDERDLERVLGVLRMQAGGSQ